MNEKRYLITSEGTSATGKGTRHSQLLLFLMDKFEYSYAMTYYGTDPYVTGIIIDFPEHYNLKPLLFLGRIVRSNKGNRLLSWSSFDNISSNTTKTSFINRSDDVDIMVRNYSLLEQMAKYNTEFSIIGEGYPGVGLNPSEYSKYFDEILVNTFTYDELEQLLSRCEERSGSRPKGHASFSSQGKVNRTVYEIKNSKATNIVLNEYKYDERVTIVGEKVLNLLGLDSLIDSFKAFSLYTPAIRHNDEPDTNERTWGKYFEETKLLDSNTDALENVCKFGIKINLFDTVHIREKFKNSENGEMKDYRIPFSEIADKEEYKEFMNNKIII